MLNPKEFDFSNIKLLTMKENLHGNLPFFCRIYTQDEVTANLHAHEYTQINYILSGKACHDYDNNKVDVFEGDVFVIPPYIPHRIIPQENIDLKIVEIEVDTELLTQECTQHETVTLLLDFVFLEPYIISSQPNIGPRLNLSGVFREEMEKLMFEVVHEFTVRSDGYELLIKNLIINLIVKLGRAFRQAPIDLNESASFEKHHQSIEMALDYIHNNYAERLTIEEVAKIAMLSPSYFSYIFKNITHRTFVGYVNDLRLNISKDLLRMSNYNIGEICFAVGFNNISHFNHLFKSENGLTPSTYRKKHQTSHKEKKC